VITRRRFFGFVAGLAILLAADVARPAAVAGTDDAGLRRLRNFIERVQTLRARFRQDIVDSSEELIEQSSGELLLSRPGRFRWNYQQPYERTVVADGTRLWLYEADLEQVTVRPLTAGLGETPAALLTGDKDILERFEYVSSWTTEQVLWVRLRPHSADSDFESVAIGFDGERPVQLELHDRLGQRTRLYLTEVRINVKLAADAFRFVVPEGADVIGETGSQQ
jgi:outer membrane lipoprotein carrier protein